jgi:hypothetical protein
MRSRLPEEPGNWRQVEGNRTAAFAKPQGRATTRGEDVSLRGRRIFSLSSVCSLRQSGQLSRLLLISEVR